MACTEPQRGVVERAWRAGGCALVDLLAWGIGWAWIDPDENPSLAGARAAALAELARMERSPVPLARPVVVLNGYHAWAGVVESTLRKLARVTSGDERDFLAVSFMDQTCFEAQRARALSEIGAWAGAGAAVDAVAISMGGLVGRHCAMLGHADGRVLRVSRYFTLASPHRGATLARVAALDSTARSMRTGSAFLKQLDESPTTIERFFPFTHLRDPVVGARNTAPHGVHPAWCSGARVLAHFSVAHNPIVLVTIARELRGERPLFAWTPSAPPRD